MKIEYVNIDRAKDLAPPSTVTGFGQIFAPLMFVQEYHRDKGWFNVKIKPFENISLPPSAAVFHYAQEIFEGTKAYRRMDGGINLFRPLENLRRFNRSASRLAMPTIPEEDHLQAIKELILLQSNWVPFQKGSSLYIRPTMIATNPMLGVVASPSYMHFIIVSPVAAYFKEGFNPVSVEICDKYRRAVRGGVGAAKTGGNYAASLLVSEEAKKKGYSQVLWLDAIEGRYIEEVGAMNIFFVYDNNTLVTPPLSDSILPGITRDSVLRIAPNLGFEVREQAITVDEMLLDLKSGKITEIFGSGTAAVIAPVGRLGFRDEDFIVNNKQAGPVAQKLFQELTDIQYGRSADKFEWTMQI